LAETMVLFEQKPHYRTLPPIPRKKVLRRPAI